LGRFIYQECIFEIKWR